MPERVSSRRYRARVEYDGTDFAGFQVNPGMRTVQGLLEDALSRLGNEAGRRVDGAGRTDAGVHATGQVIAFSYDGRLDTTELGKALDALLPIDVSITGVRRVPDTFQPRYAARYREYRYTVWNGPRSPLRERMALGVRAPLDTAAMVRPDRSSSAGTTSEPSGRRTAYRSGPCSRSGSVGRAGS